jgi:hypothetical protein
MKKSEIENIYLDICLHIAGLGDSISGLSNLHSVSLKFPNLKHYYIFKFLTIQKINNINSNNPSYYLSRLNQSSRLHFSLAYTRLLESEVLASKYKLGSLVLLGVY